MTFVRSLPGIVAVLSISALTACDFGLEAQMMEDLARLAREIQEGLRKPTPEELDLVRDQLWCVTDPGGALLCTMKDDGLEGQPQPQP